jgi:hypothetical protein
MRAGVKGGKLMQTTKTVPGIILSFTNSDMRKKDLTHHT